MKSVYILTTEDKEIIAASDSLYGACRLAGDYALDLDYSAIGLWRKEWDDFSARWYWRADLFIGDLPTASLMIDEVDFIGGEALLPMDVLADPEFAIKA